MEYCKEYAKYLYDIAGKVKIRSSGELEYISRVCALVQLRDEIEVAYIKAGQVKSEIENLESFIRKNKIKDFLKE
jgi:hypothetical protein